MANYNPPSENVPIFNASYYLYGGGNLTLSQANQLYAKLTGSVIRGLMTFNAGLATTSIKGLSGSSSFSVPSISISDTIAGLQTQQIFKNKKIQYSSNSSISSIVSNNFITTAQHGLQVGDTIKFPNVGSITGILANVIYTVSAIQSTTSFSLSGTTVSGSGTNAYYVIVDRGSNNFSANGGLLVLQDFNNTNNGLYFDLTGATQSILLRFPLTTASPIIFPASGGTLANLSSTQTFSGSTTFSSTLTASGLLSCTRSGNAATTNGTIYINPASTAMSGSNSYFFTYLNTPAATGTTTGTSATFIIAGPATGATITNNYAQRIIAGVLSIPSGTVTAPSIVFDTGKNNSGIYSASANTLNVAVSGSNRLSVDATGIIVAGKTTSSQLQVGTNGSTFSQIAVGNFTLNNPNISGQNSVSQVINHNLGTVPTAIFCNFCTTGAQNSALNFLLCTVFNMTATQATILITNTHTIATTAGNFVIGWQAVV